MNQCAKKNRNKQRRKSIIFEYKLAHEKQSFLPQKRGGQFKPNLHCHFKPNLRGQLHRTLHSSTITKLKSHQGYNIPFVTIYSILRFENYTLKKFFDEFENQFGKNIIE